MPNQLYALSTCRYVCVKGSHRSGWNVEAAGNRNRNALEFGRRTRQPARRELLVLLECGELPVPETLAGGREIASDPEPCDRE